MMATVRGSRIERLAIMQYFINNEKKQIIMAVSRLFWILLLQNLSKVNLTFCFICMAQPFCIVFQLGKYHKIILKFKMFLPHVNQVIHWLT